MAQDNSFKNLFSSYLGSNASGYLGPLADIVGGSLNSGFVKPAAYREGFFVRLDLQMAATFLSDDQKVFQAVTEGAFFPETTASVPTIVGAGSGTVVQGDGGTAYVFPAGLAINRVLLAIPQLTVGMLGTDVSVRWAGVDIDDVGKFNLLGIGGRHNISQYFSDVPVDLAVGYHFHAVSLGDILDLTSMIASVHASHTTGAASFYGGVGYESTTMDIRYENSAQEISEIEIALAGPSGVRITGGIALDLSFLTIFGDYTLGGQNAATFGISIGN